MDQPSLCLSEKGQKRISCHVFSMNLPPLKFIYCRKSSMFFIFFSLLTQSYTQAQQVALHAHFCVNYIPQKLKGFSVSSSPPGLFSRCLQGFVDKHIWRFGATGTWQRKVTFSTTTPRSPSTARAPRCSSRLTNLSTNPSRKVKWPWTMCQLLGLLSRVALGWALLFSLSCGD